VREEDKQSEHYEEGICCERCHDVLTPEKRARLEEREKQSRLAAKRGEAHLGMSIKDAQRKKLEHKRALGAEVPKYLEIKVTKEQRSND